MVMLLERFEEMSSDQGLSFNLSLLCSSMCMSPFTEVAERARP